jgi:hypothetical protein
MYKKLMTPEYKLILQTAEISSGFNISYRSSEEAHCDTCRIYLSDEAADAIGNAYVGDCRVDMGSEEDYDNIIDGMGRWERDGTEILVVDGMHRLLNSDIKATFLECHPQEAIRYILTLCGVTDYILDDTVYNTKKTFTVNTKDGCEAIKAVNAAWGINVPFFYWDDIFYWGKRPDQEEVYELNDSNILDLEKNGDRWTAEVIGVPWIHHSQYININHRRLIAVGDVKEVIIESSEKGFTDMYITFEEVPDDG